MKTPGLADAMIPAPVPPSPPRPPVPLGFSTPFPPRPARTLSTVFPLTITFALARSATLSVTVEKDGRRANATPAVRTLFPLRTGELSIAVTARSGRSTEGHVTDPTELALNWNPIQGQGRTLAFAWNTIS